MRSLRKKYLGILYCAILGILLTLVFANININKKNDSKINTLHINPVIKKNKKYVFDDINQVYYYLCKDNPLKHDYIPHDLTLFKNNSLRHEYLRKEANVALEKLFSESEHAGYPLLLVSGYRSYDYQVKLYNEYLKDNTAEELAKIDDLPGKSEHQLGLAVDLADKEQNYVLKKTFRETKTFNWLYQNSYKFGFILRYPKDKENITGYMFHPWHFRYVGKALAREIYDSGLSFDEFVDKNK